MLILLLLAACYLVIQNLIGLSIISLTSFDPVIGIISGSVSFSGGHGTAIAWAPSFVERYNIENAMVIGIACATFGLVFGGIIGGPISCFLIKKHQLKSSSNEQITVGVPYNDEHQVVDIKSMLNAILVISVTVGIGIHVHQLLVYLKLQLPLFVTCLFSGIIMTNTIPLLFRNISWPTGTATLALISDLSLGLFLAISLMSLQLWTPIDLAGPIVFVLLAQIVGVIMFAIFVVFRLMGKNYDAAVMSAGYAGLALGATPTAIANMTAVIQKYGASPQAFLVIPLVGAFFIDITNAFIIELMLNIFG